MIKKNHIYAISLMRFIATLLIICCHTCEWIGYTLGKSNLLGIFGNYCAVGVQIFLIMSGYLYGLRKDLFEKENFTHFIFRNFKKVLLDYYIYVVLVIIPVYYFISPETINIHTLWKILTCSGVIGGVHHLWYIPYVLATYLITPFLYDFKQYYLQKYNRLTSLIGMMAIIMLMVEIIGFSYNSYFVSAWINCYILGFFLSDIQEKIKPMRQVIVTAIIFVFSTVLNYYKLHVRYELLPQYKSGLKYNVCNYYINYSRVLFALAIFCIVMLIGGKITNKDKTYKFLNWSDKYSYDIYLVHMIYIKGALSLLNITNSYMLNIAVMLLATTFSAFVLHKISDYFKIRMEK